MRASTLVILVGALVFVLPIPGTFVLGALLVLAGLVARLFGL
ncbi:MULTISPECIES: transporter [Halorubrum]|nr:MULTISPECIES: transporter [Halorubrum]